MRKIQVGDFVWYRREVPSYSYHEGRFEVEAVYGDNLQILVLNRVGYPSFHLHTKASFFIHEDDFFMTQAMVNMLTVTSGLTSQDLLDKARLLVDDGEDISGECWGMFQYMSTAELIQVFETLVEAMKQVRPQYVTRN